MSAGDRLVQPGACTWCSHPPHPGKVCPVQVEYPVELDPSKSAKKSTLIYACRCQIGRR